MGCFGFGLIELRVQGLRTKGLDRGASTLACRVIGLRLRASHIRGAQCPERYGIPRVPVVCGTITLTVSLRKSHATFGAPKVQDLAGLCLQTLKYS